MRNYARISSVRHLLCVPGTSYKNIGKQSLLFVEFVSNFDWSEQPMVGLCLLSILYDSDQLRERRGEVGLAVHKHSSFTGR